MNPRRPAAQSASGAHSSTLRDPLPNGSGKAGLGAIADESWNTGATSSKFPLGWRMSGSNGRPHALEECEVHKRHAHLDTMRHARPIRISEQLVSHVPACFKGCDLGMLARASRP